MSDFSELIKSFERIREYIRQIFVYGFKVRNDFTGKSPRTYDNERRRVESYLADYIKTAYSPRGKQLSISVDSRHIPQNPLYAAWKAKSFTDNDIMLHFFILDYLSGNKEASVQEITDGIEQSYHVLFEEQTVRFKLKEYESLGILTAKKLGKSLYYSCLATASFEETDVYPHLIDGIKFFQETAPFGFIGSTLLDRARVENDLFRFKHHYIVHTLEDGILHIILEAIRKKACVLLENKSARTGQTTTHRAVPFKIFVSTRTGRRYVCLYSELTRRFSNMRLDSITKAEILEYCTFYEEKQDGLSRNLPKCFGVSFDAGSRQARIEEIYLKLRIDEQREPFVLERLYREARGGEILKVCENTFLYSGVFYDTNELLPWIKTFTGRILDIQGSNTYVINKLIADFHTLYQMYCEEEET